MINQNDSILIGEALTRVSMEYPDRFIIRMSNGGHNVMSANSDQNPNGDEFTCPEQLGKVKDCASCGLCWTSKKSVLFLTHGIGEVKSKGIDNNSTRFAKTIRNPKTTKVLKPGCDNSKLGGKVICKKFNGYNIFQITLVERETCPTNCIHWKDCYGNGMPFAHRFRGNNVIMGKIDHELNNMIGTTVLVRLHVLGDFFSVEYVDFWRKMLQKYAYVAVFGYTAHPVNNDWRK